jgi:hypothetical protein
MSFLVFFIRQADLKTMQQITVIFPNPMFPGINCRIKQNIGYTHILNKKINIRNLGLCE